MRGRKRHKKKAMKAKLAKCKSETLTYLCRDRQ